MSRVWEGPWGRRGRDETETERTQTQIKKGKDQRRGSTGRQRCNGPVREDRRKIPEKKERSEKESNNQRDVETLRQKDGEKSQK